MGDGRDGARAGRGGRAMTMGGGRPPPPSRALSHRMISQPALLVAAERSAGVVALGLANHCPPRSALLHAERTLSLPVTRSGCVMFANWIQAAFPNNVIVEGMAVLFTSPSAPCIDERHMNSGVLDRIVGLSRPCINYFRNKRTCVAMVC